MRRLILGLSAILLAFVSVPSAQLRVVPIDEEQGHVALGLALRHLANVGIFMHTTAHPDDENNGLLVMLNRGQGYRTALATATRGNGGQNEIGPEIFEALGVLRTGELAALHRFDGAEQYFTRAVDFGYSFGLEETFEKWGREEITADYVRLIRMIRPDVIITLPPTGNAGGQHHMASAIITRDAYKLAGDPTKFPEQLKDGLRPWQPKKLYHSAGFGFPGEPPTSGRVMRVNSGVYDPLLGRTYAEIGSEARSMHKCQGMGQFLLLPSNLLAGGTYQLVETTMPAQMQKDETSLFDGIDSSIGSLASFAGSSAPKELSDGLSAIASAVQAAQKAFDASADASALKPLLDGLTATRALRQAIGRMSIDDAGKFEIDFRLRQKENEFQQAAILAQGAKIEAFGDDGLVVPGQSVKVNVLVANRGTGDVTVRQVKIDGFSSAADCAMTAFNGGSFGFGGGGRGRGGNRPPEAPMSTIHKDQVAHCEPALVVPATARVSEPYWHRKGEEGRYTLDADAPFGLPMRPTAFNAEVTLTMGADAVPVTETMPIQHRYEGDVFSGEKRSDLLVVPAFSVRVTPQIAVVPAASIRSAPANRRTTAQREVRVTVVNDTAGAAEASARLEAPQGWTVTPATQTVKFDRQDEEQTIRFEVKPGASTTTGGYEVRAVVTSTDGRTFNRGFQVIEYPHITRYHIYDDSLTTLKVIDVRTPANLTIGYIMGVGDQVPPAIEQLGAKVELIDADELAWGNLSRYDAIITGVRAYERRADLRSNNRRLLEYVFNGGTAIVQYNKFEFNEAQYGPYPAKVSSDRVTDEFAPPKILDSHNPIFTTPNEIGEAAWKNWVQERGLYFLGEKDPRYHDLIQLEDNFTYNRGVKNGALVEASYGKGRWVYVGLGLWRQLPAGTDGAYQLLANLISLGHAPKPVSSSK
ncbi:MAG TPA: PIG-L family deacetylase [Vicinamibacterales bacterium]